MTITEQTFEEWLANPELSFLTPETSDGLARARDMYERQMESARNYPTVIPPCPSWCVNEAGHRYDDFGSGLSYSRQHHAFEGSGVFVSALETYTVGEGPRIVELGCFVDEQTHETPTALRSHMIELGLAADALERALAQS